MLNNFLRFSLNLEINIYGCHGSGPMLKINFKV
jgi:hypothetical protein